ncbi:MAG TPA: hypothetical protein VGV64_02640 [Thermoplasmata archaeon]|nr:hypothetical protein [Thermoplasmata archaeon]
MSPDADAELLARIAALEQEVRGLKARLQAAERLIAPRGEHPVDQSVVRQKVTYDWQA